MIYHSVRILGLGALTLAALGLWRPQTHAVQSATSSRVSRPINVRDYGARGDGGYVSDAAIAAGSSKLTSPSGRFRIPDAGKPIVVLGAGPAINGKPDPLVTTIAAVMGPQTLRLACPAATGATGTWASWGTDNGPAIKKAFDVAALAGSAVVYFPTGIYRSSEVLTLDSSNVHLQGEGTESVLLMGNVYTSKTSAHDSGDGLPVLFVGQPHGPALSNIEIDNLKFVNVGSQVEDKVNGAGLIEAPDYATVSNIKIHDLTIETASRCGITLAADTDTYEIYNVDVIGGLHAFYLAGGGRNGYVHDNTLYNVPSLAQLYNSIGIVVKNQRNVRIIRNKIADYAMYGVLLTPEFSDQQILVDANIITNVGSGIGVGGEKAITVSNNAIDGCQHFGIWVYGTHPDNVTQQIRIENNVIRRVAGYGIVAESRNQGHVTDVVIQSNRLYECEGGIQVNGLQGSNIVDDNIVTSSSVRKKLLGFYMLHLDASDTKFSRNASMNYLTSEVPSNILGPNNVLK